MLTHTNIYTASGYNVVTDYSAYSEGTHTHTHTKQTDG